MKKQVVLGIDEYDRLLPDISKKEKNNKRIRK